MNEKQGIKINENQLDKLVNDAVKESIKSIINENAFNNLKGGLQSFKNSYRAEKKINSGENEEYAEDVKCLFSAFNDFLNRYNKGEMNWKVYDSLHTIAFYSKNLADKYLDKLQEPAREHMKNFNERLKSGEVPRMGFMPRSWHDKGF